MAAAKTYGTFTKGDRTRTASSPADVVRYEFDGWKRETEPQSAQPASSDGAGKSTGKS